jgi:hypothetical protein
LLQAVPYLLGFHPSRSLVLVGLRDGTLAVTARVDLVDASPPTLSHTLGVMSRGGATSVIGAVYDDEALPMSSGAPPWDWLAETLADEAEAVDITLLDVLFVARGRWWSLDCRSPDCCPPDGRELPADPSPFAAAATYDGVVALPDRAAVEALLDPRPHPDGAAEAAKIAAAKDALIAEGDEAQIERRVRAVKRALFAAARTSQQPNWVGVSDDDLVRFAAGLGVVAVRDPLWVAIDTGRIDGRPLWRELGRRLPGPYSAAALFLFGWASWRAGDGTLAGIAAERAIECDPDYSAADILLAALAHGVDPRRMPRLRKRPA